jgi:hypothetical protein
LRNSDKRYYWLCLSDSLSDAEQITTRLVAPNIDPDERVRTSLLLL